MKKGGNIIAIPRFSLVVVMGPEGDEKSAFIRQSFPATALVSAEQCRSMVADDPAADWASAEAHALLETWISARLKLGRLTVVDSTALEPRFRARMIDLAREYHAPAMLLFVDVTRIGRGRGGRRSQDGSSRQAHRFQKAMARVGEEGWNKVFRIGGDLEPYEVEIRPLRVDCLIPPPYDLIGDIHGCYRELRELLEKLGYREDEVSGFSHPEGRRVVFVGDLVDRGPESLQVLQAAMRMHRAGTALVTPGNHDNKLLTFLTGGRVRVDHGLELTSAEMNALTPDTRKNLIARVIPWLRGLPPYLLLDKQKLVVAHAGLPEHLQGRLSRSVAAWALYGEVKAHRGNGRSNNRVEWPLTYRGRATVVYGHTPSADALFRGNTICIDQGCVFGGKLTCFRYPEREIVQVFAHETYYPDDVPDLEVVNNVSNQSDDNERDGNDAEEVGDGAASENRSGAPSGDRSEGKRGARVDGQHREESAPKTGEVSPERPKEEGARARCERLPDILPLLTGAGLATRWMGPIQLKSQQVSVALDEVTRFGVDPRWIVFVPPPVIPSASSHRRDYVEHPEEVFQYYRGSGLTLVLEEMHFAARGVAIIGRDDEVCARRFGIEAPGIIYTTTGRPFFDEKLQEQVILRLRDDLEHAGAFERLESPLIIFDAGFAPWSIRNPEFVSRRCSPAAIALEASRALAIEALDMAMARGVAVRRLLRDVAECEFEGSRRLHRAIEKSIWPVQGVESLRIFPFQILAGENELYVEKDRLWHLEELDRWCDCSEIFLPIRRAVVKSADEELQALELWDEISSNGEGGVIIRSMDWCPRADGRPELPAVKVRGRESLRLIYGPQYLSPNALARLKQRPLRARRVSSLRTWALASEGLHLFASGAPYADYHPYALAVVALRNELKGRLD